jgi:hypothetical protein
MWRFEPISDKSLDYVYVVDLDLTVSASDVATLRAWEDSGLEVLARPWFRPGEAGRGTL